MKKLILLIFTSLISSQALAAELVLGELVPARNICEGLLEARPGEHSPDVVKVMSGFANERFTLSEKVQDLKVIEIDSPTDVLDRAKQKFLAQLAIANDTFSFVPKENLGISFKPSGSVSYSATFDYMKLLGRQVVGFHSDNEFPKTESNASGQRRLSHVDYFAGTVEGVKFDIENSFIYGQGTNGLGTLFLKIRGLDGVVRSLSIDTRGYNFDSDEGTQLFVLEAKRSPQDLLRQAFYASEMHKLPEQAFGTPTTHEDFEMAYAAVSTILAVPPTFKATAVLKILLGRAVKNGETFPNFGIAKGKKRYSEAKLAKLIGPIYEFMEKLKIVGKDISGEIRDRAIQNPDDQNEKIMPDYISVNTPTSLAPIFLNLWNELRTGRP